MEDGRLIVHGVADSSTGYGQATARLLEALGWAGIPCRFALRSDSDVVEDFRPLDPAIRSRLVGEPVEGPGLGIGRPSRPERKSILLTMWEATRLPPSVVKCLNRYRAVVVPCDANARWFGESGVTAPIRVVPLGIDPSIHRPDRRPPRAGFKVGCGGRVHEWAGNRKGLDVVMAAFLDAFPGDDDAILEVKIFRDRSLRLPSHPRVRFVQDAMTDGELADWYRSLDVFASASKGEGWGLQPHQAMACGTPVIAPAWGGHAHYMTPGSSWPVEFDEEVAGPPYNPAGRRTHVVIRDAKGRVTPIVPRQPHDPGKWCVARHGSLVDQLRSARSDDATRRAKGRAAATRAAEFPWSRSGSMLADVVREFGLWRPRTAIL